MNRHEITSQLDRVYEELHEAGVVTNGSFIAGGCFASMVRDEPVNDYDIWFETREAFEAARDSALKAARRGDALSLLAETKYAYTFRLNGSKNVIQLVQSRIGSPIDVVRSFDFRHAMAFYSPTPVRTLYLDEGFILSKTLSYMRGNLKYPLNTFQRLLKFQARGYTIPEDTLKHLLADINAADKALIEEDTSGSC